ncbi:hypothetical protein EalM132_00048 [Exiguobacterium phage vB_EalM-132]|nr:hypothetical protein EalM132_00048 [Exiguobacterium phage vB_EalM-132]
MSRADNFKKKWIKSTTDTMELAEKNLIERMENKEWYSDISGAKELIEQAGLKSVGMAVTHEGLILLQKIVQDSISKSLAEQLPDLIRTAVREELTHMVESNRETEPEEQVVTKPKPKIKKDKDLNRKDKEAGFSKFRLKQDSSKLIYLIKTETARIGHVSNKALCFLLEVEYKLVLPPQNSSQAIKYCMEKDSNIEKIGRGTYKYKL